MFSLFSQDMVEVKVTEGLWNRTGGLCGLMDGHATNDLETEQDSVIAYANKWQANSPSGMCTQLAKYQTVPRWPLNNE